MWTGRAEEADSLAGRSPSPSAGPAGGANDRFVSGISAGLRFGGVTGSVQAHAAGCADEVANRPRSPDLVRGLIGFVPFQRPGRLDLLICPGDILDLLHRVVLNTGCNERRHEKPFRAPRKNPANWSFRPDWEIPGISGLRVILMTRRASPTTTR